MNKMAELMEALDRAKVLLKATQEILQKQEESPFVLNVLEQTTIWDDVECGGYCLKEDIQDWFDLYAKEGVEDKE